MAERAETLPALRRPMVLEGALDVALGGLHAEQRFDLILGRNALVRTRDKVDLIAALSDRLVRPGTMVFAETKGASSQRLYEFAGAAAISSEARDAWQEAEEKLYSDPEDPLTGWSETALVEAIEAAGYGCRMALESTHHHVMITHSMVQRWLADGAESYRSRVVDRLPETARDEVLGVIRS